jgi:hypothetical protein
MNDEDEKDRWGQKVHDVERAREDQWARERDRLLLEKLRSRKSASLRCPRCNAELQLGIADEPFAMMCPDGHGAWFEGPALEHLMQRYK